MLTPIPELAYGQESCGCGSPMSCCLLRFCRTSCWSIERQITISSLPTICHTDCLAGKHSDFVRRQVLELTVKQNSAASAGLATGGSFFAPIPFKLGRSSVIFWTLIASAYTMSCSHDIQRSVQLFDRLTLLFWILWWCYWCPWSPNFG